MHSVSLIIFTALPHISLCVMWASCDVRCRYLEHFSLCLSCFRSGGAGWLPLGDEHWHRCLNYMYLLSAMLLAKFRRFSLFWWLLRVSHPVIHNSLRHRRLACTCRGSQLFSFLEVLGSNSCNPFYRWFSWDRTIVCPDAFVLHSKISSRSVFDDVWWLILIYGNTWVACLCNK